MSAGPGKRDTTISEEDFKKTIDHLPEGQVQLILTGGEIFTEKDRLFSGLEYINRKNKGKRWGIEVELQTNAFWAMNRNAKDIMKELAMLGVVSLDITSNDYFHKEQGLDVGELDSVYEMAEKYFQKVSLRGSGRLVLPVGRAEKNQLYTGVPSGWNFCHNFLNKKDVHVDSRGNVYACCFGAFQLPGNLIESPLSKIIQRATGDERLLTLNEQGIEGLMVKDGFANKKEARECVETYGSCGICSEVYPDEFVYNNT